MHFGSRAAAPAGTGKNIRVIERHDVLPEIPGDAHVSKAALPIRPWGAVRLHFRAIPLFLKIGLSPYVSIAPGSACQNHDSGETELHSYHSKWTSPLAPLWKAARGSAHRPLSRPAPEHKAAVADMSRANALVTKAK